MYFGLLLATGVFFIFIAFTMFLPVMVLMPQKFALCFTLGCAMIIGSFFALKGPKNQLQHMSSAEVSQPCSKFCLFSSVLISCRNDQPYCWFCRFEKFNSSIFFFFAFRLSIIFLLFTCFMFLSFSISRGFLLHWDSLAQWWVQFMFPWCFTAIFFRCSSLCYRYQSLFYLTYYLSPVCTNTFVSLSVECLCQKNLDRYQPDLVPDGFFGMSKSLRLG